MRTRFSVSIVLILLLTAPAARNAAPQEGRRTLTLEEALRLGAASSAQLAQAEHRKAEAAGRFSEARFQSLPQAALSASYLRLSEVDPGAIAATTPMGPVNVSFGESILDSTAFKLAVRQPLFTGHRIRSSIRQAEALLSASRSDLERAGQTASAAIEGAYWATALAKEAAEAFAENVRQAELHLADARNLLAQGLLTVNDALRAELRLSGARMRSVEADSNLTAARTRLNLLVGLPWNEATDTAPVDENLDAASIDSLPPLEALIALALERRPEIASARSRIVAAEAAFRMAKSPLYPGLSLIGDATIASPNSRVFPPRDGFDATWSVGVQVALDAGRIPATLAQTKQASARLALSLDALKPTQDQVTQEVVASYLELSKSIEQIRNARTYRLQAEESLRTTRALFSRGVALDSDVADAEAALLSARLEDAAARIGALSARSGLRLALGGDPPTAKPGTEQEPKK